MKINKCIQILFSNNVLVSRKSYLITGSFLMLIKYLLESSISQFYLGRFLTAAEFLSPLYSSRDSYLSHLPLIAILFIAITSLVFLWIGISMSMRRAVDAGRSSSIGMFFLFPVLNFILMLLLCIFPSKPIDFESSNNSSLNNKDKLLPLFIKVALASIAITVILVLVSVYLLHDYGIGLFFATPFLVGILASVESRKAGYSDRSTSLKVASGSIFVAGAALLLFAFEGVLCIAMALPIALIAALIGNQVASIIFNFVPKNRLNSFVIPSILITFLGVISSQDNIQFRTREITTSVVINAPLEKVWNNVISFTEIKSPPSWFFKLGIAYPIRARIEGAGVGALRYCEFSTGPFVEPITVWDEPKRLAFSVQSQPPPLNEFTLYSKITPPHLLNSLQSHKGEFRLIKLSENMTLLEGHTWYSVNMAPQFYWTIWSDTLIHAIHSRVLEHIKSEASK